MFARFFFVIRIIQRARGCEKFIERSFRSADRWWEVVRGVHIWPGAATHGCSLTILIRKVARAGAARLSGLKSYYAAQEKFPRAPRVGYSHLCACQHAHPARAGLPEVPAWKKDRLM